MVLVRSDRGNPVTGASSYELLSTCLLLGRGDDVDCGCA